MTRTVMQPPPIVTIYPGIAGKHTGIAPMQFNDTKHNLTYFSFTIHHSLFAK